MPFIAKALATKLNERSPKPGSMGYAETDATSTTDPASVMLDHDMDTFDEFQFNNRIRNSSSPMWDDNQYGADSQDTVQELLGAGDEQAFGPEVSVLIIFNIFCF